MSAIISLTRIKKAAYSLQWRFIIAYLLIIIVAFGVVAASVIQLVGEYLFTQRKREEVRAATETATQVVSPLRNYDIDRMNQIVCDAGSALDARVLLLDENGTVLADSEDALNGRRLSLKQVANVLAGASSDYAYYRSEALNACLHSDRDYGAVTGICVTRVISGGSLSGMVVYVSGAQDIYDDLVGVMRRVGITLLAVFIVVGVLSVLIGRMFTHPVRDLSEGIQRMTKSDFKARVRVRGKNEFSELAGAFNTMCQRMETLDRSRNQFVSNASHELKTPLSTMKILLQTLLYQEVYDPAISREFLTDIDKEIYRLSAVISDLLTLVSVDSGELKLKTAPLSLRDLINDNVRRLAPLARERGIELQFTGRENVEIVGDHMKLTQVFYNLIDNAIKYTPRGGRVHVELSKQGKTAVVRVADNGIGIPEEDRLHIFDRFYRVDKARSRETGGTGLGLSIVKQIVLLHDGNISVSSRENEGSTFTVELPLLQKTTGGKAHE